MLEAQEERVSFALIGHATLRSKHLLLVSSVVDEPAFDLDTDKLRMKVAMVPK